MFWTVLAHHAQILPYCAGIIVSCARSEQFRVLALQARVDLVVEIIALEDLGFVPRGQGGPCSAAGFTARDGAKPMNASGGLKSKGHPVGATGVAQICDIVQQIRGEAGERQLARHSLGLAQNLGGSGATCVVTILGEV